MPGRRCHVSGCREINAEENVKENGITFFKVPNSALSKWQAVMPTSNLTNMSRICSRHFDEEDIVKGREILNVFFPYKRWNLRTGALPKHFLSNSSKYYNFILVGDVQP